LNAHLHLSCLYIITENNKELAETYFNIAVIIKDRLNSSKSAISPDSDDDSDANVCIKYLLEAHKISPCNIDILINLAEINRMLDRHKNALGYIEIALKISNKDYRVYYEGFLIYEEIGDYYTAKEMMRVCLILNVSFVKGYNALGNLMRKEKMHDMAIELFEVALSREPNNITVLNNYANCYFEMGNKKRAKEVYLQAYNIDNNQYEVNCNLSIIYKKECKNFYSNFKIIMTQQ